MSKLYRYKRAMADQLLSIIEKSTEDDPEVGADNPNNPFQKYKLDKDEDDCGCGLHKVSSEDGNPAHTHELERDETGKVVAHGPASKGADHKHEIVDGQLTGSDHSHKFHVAGSKDHD